MSTTFVSAWTNTAYQDPFSAVIYNKKIYLFGQYGQLMLNSIALSCLQPDGTLPTSQTALDAAVTIQPFSINSQYETIHSQHPSAAAAVVSGVSLCVFWNDDRTGAVASICNGTTADAGPRPWYSLCDTSGNPLSANTATTYDLAATCIDNQSVLVGMHYDTPSGRAIYLGYFEPANVQNPATGSNEPGTWHASAQWIVPYATLFAGSPSPVLTSELDTSLRLASYALGVPASPNASPQAWLALTTFSPSNNQGYLSWLSLDTATPGVPLIGGVESSAQSVLQSAANCVSFGTPLQLALGRDPSGSVRVYSVISLQAGTHISIWLQPGDQPAGAGATFLPDTLGLCYGPTTTQALTVDAPLAAVYPVGANAIATDVLNDTIPTAVSAYPVSEAILAHVHQSAMTAFSQPLGRAQQVPNILMASTTTSPLLVAQGIFDGPFPLPGVQVASWAGTDKTFASVKYGTMSEQLSSRTFTVDRTYGVSYEQQPSNGVGLAWEFAANFGFGDVNATTQSFVTALDVVQDAIPNDPNNPTNIVANGTIFGTSVAFYADVYRFLIPDPGGSTGYVIAPNAPIWAAIWAAPLGRQKVVYEPYAVTPGDITSYTREAWNATMHGLGYPSWNYFEEVVLPNAYLFDELNSQYLEIAIAIGAPDNTSVQLQNSDYTESSWTFDTSIYVGAGFNAKVDIFGLGVGVEGKFLAGSGFAIESNEVTTSTTAWGISVDGVFLPSPSQPTPIDGTNGVKAYGVRLYLLPALQLWTAELDALAPAAAARLDPQSAPWRIVYEVYDYELEGNIFYPPNSAPPVPPAAPAVDATKLEFPAFACSIWQGKPSASYMVSFWNARGETAGPWSAPVSIGPGACPQIQIPVDATQPSVTTRRLLYRSLNKQSPQLVATVAGNDPSDNTFYDDEPSVNIVPPNQIELAATSQWAARTQNQSAVWSFNNSIAYAVSFTFAAAGKAAPLPVQWARESMISPLCAWTDILLFAKPQLTGIPTFPTTTGLPKCTGRNLYRTVYKGTGGNGTLIENLQFIGHIADNTTQTFIDSMD